MVVLGSVVSLRIRINWALPRKVYHSYLRRLHGAFRVRIINVNLQDTVQRQINRFFGHHRPAIEANFESRH
jgi:hypothetical protein